MKKLFALFESHAAARFPHARRSPEQSAQEKLDVIKEAKEKIPVYISQCISKEKRSGIDIAMELLNRQEIMSSDWLVGYAFQDLLHKHKVPVTLKSTKHEKPSLSIVVALWGPDDLLEEILAGLPADEVNYRGSNGLTMLHHLCSRRYESWCPPSFPNPSLTNIVCLADKMISAGIDSAAKKMAINHIIRDFGDLELNTRRPETEQLLAILGDRQWKGLSEALALKDDGNKWFAKGNNEAAVRQYGCAMVALLREREFGALDSEGSKLMAVLLSNSSQCYLNIRDNTAAAHASSASLLLDPSNTKSLLRRATAFERLRELPAATADCEAALSREPGNPNAKAMMQRLLDAAAAGGEFPSDESSEEDDSGDEALDEWLASGCTAGGGRARACDIVAGLGPGERVDVLYGLMDNTQGRETYVYAVVRTRDARLLCGDTVFQPRDCSYEVCGRVIIDSCSSSRCARGGQCLSAHLLCIQL